MKRYLVFAGRSYYPSGGADDFLYDTDDLTIVVLPAKESAYKADWVNVLDTKTGMTVDVPEVTDRIIRNLQKRDKLWFQYYMRHAYTAIDADERARVQFFEELSNP